MSARQRLHVLPSTWLLGYVLVLGAAVLGSTVVTCSSSVPGVWSFSTFFLRAGELVSCCPLLTLSCPRFGSLCMEKCAPSLLQFLVCPRSSHSVSGHSCYKLLVVGWYVSESTQNGRSMHSRCSCCICTRCTHGNWTLFPRAPRSLQSLLVVVWVLAFWHTQPVFWALHQLELPG